MLRRTSRLQHFACNAIKSQALPSRRAFIRPSAIYQADLVQDLYLSELKKYKPTPVKPSDAEGHVQKFAAPKAPQSPEEGNIASELKAYEDQTVELEGQTAAGEASSKEDDWFEEEAEDDVAHGH